MTFKFPLPLPTLPPLERPGPQANQLPSRASPKERCGPPPFSDVGLSATAYDLPAGNSLTLVIDTLDPLYYEENAGGGWVTVAGGSYADIPLK
jgi:hypothetical protein